LSGWLPRFATASPEAAVRCDACQHVPRYSYGNANNNSHTNTVGYTNSDADCYTNTGWKTHSDTAAATNTVSAPHAVARGWNSILRELAKEAREFSR
jgi:hypothetical protein